MSEPIAETKAKSARQIVWQAVRDLYDQEQVVTRETLRDTTGLKLHIIDDHVKNLIEDGDVRRVRDGVFVPVPRYEPPRPVYGAMTVDGFFVLEIGAQVVVMQPREARMAGALLAGQAMQFSNIQSGHDQNQVVNVFWEEVKKLRREINKQEKQQD